MLRNLVVRSGRHGVVERHVEKREMPCRRGQRRETLLYFIEDDLVPAVGGPPIDHQRSRAASSVVAAVTVVAAARSAAFGSSISAWTLPASPRSGEAAGRRGLVPSMRAALRWRQAGKNEWNVS